jgi:hypothetical protein
VIAIEQVSTLEYIPGSSTFTKASLSRHVHLELAVHA